MPREERGDSLRGHGARASAGLPHLNVFYEVRGEGDAFDPEEAQRQCVKAHSCDNHVLQAAGRGHCARGERRRVQMPRAGGTRPDAGRVP